MCKENYKHLLNEEYERKFHKATNGRGWSDYRIAQEKRQNEINKMVYEKRPEEISLKETLICFVIICLCVYLLTIKI